MPCFYLAPKKNDFNQIPGRLSGMTAFGVSEPSSNLRKGSIYCRGRQARRQLQKARPSH